MLDVSAVVTLRTQIATTVTVRSGRVVVDQIQIADGTKGTTAALAVTPGAPQASPTWWFADGPAGEGLSTTIAVQNPSDDAGRRPAPDPTRRRRRQRVGRPVRGHHRAPRVPAWWT